MRRKRINIKIHDLPVDVQKVICEYVQNECANMDIKTLTITGYETHTYTPKCYNDFILRLKRYIKINGNRIVNKLELASIGKISRPTIDKMINAGLIVYENEFRRYEYKFNLQNIVEKYKEFT